VSGVVYMVVQLRANEHHGGSQFFGARLTIEMTILAAPLLLRTYQTYHHGRRWAAPAVHVLLVLGVLLHTLGATVWQSPFLDLETYWQEELAELCAEGDFENGCEGIEDP